MYFPGLLIRLFFSAIMLDLPEVDNRTEHIRRTWPTIFLLDLSVVRRRWWVWNL